MTSAIFFIEPDSKYWYKESFNWELKSQGLFLFLVPVLEFLSLSCSDSPVCALQSQLFGLSVGDQIDIPCLVSANPQDLTFHWFFNKTKESKVGSSVRKIVYFNDITIISWRVKSNLYLKTNLNFISTFKENIECCIPLFSVLDWSLIRKYFLY